MLVDTGVVLVVFVAVERVVEDAFVVVVVVMLVVEALVVDVDVDVLGEPVDVAAAASKLWIL